MKYLHLTEKAAVLQYHIPIQEVQTANTVAHKMALKTHSIGTQQAKGPLTKQTPVIVNSTLYCLRKKH